jgi:hypothetical protein
MTSILKSRTNACNPQDWRLQADVDVSLQYAKANALKNMRIVGGMKFSPCKEGVRLVRFRDEKPLPIEYISFLKSSRKPTKESIIKQAPFVVDNLSKPVLASRFPKKERGPEHADVGQNECRKKANASVNSRESVNGMFNTPATVLLNQWKDALSSTDIFASISSSWLNSTDVE